MDKTGQIRNDSLERQYLIERILADMRMHRSAYDSKVMQFLFRKTPMPETLLDDSDIGCFIRQGYEMTIEDLYRGGILPKDIPGLEMTICNDDYKMPQVEIRGMEMPAAGRTDVYFLGLPGSGRSAILTGLLKYFVESGEGLFLPRTNVDYSRRGEMFSNAMVEGLCGFKVPRPTVDTPVVVMPFNIGEKHNREVTLIEYSGEAVIRLSKANQDDPEAWGKDSLCMCLRNDNPKTLCFVLSYDMICNDNPFFSEPHQAEIIENALLALNSNGSGKSGEKRCTLSRVQTIAIVFSKSDLMDTEENVGVLKKRIDRRKIAMKYLDTRLKLFMNNLSDVCEKYGINNDNYYQPYVFTFSLGDFYVGNSVVYDSTDSETLSRFLISTTRKIGFF